MTCRHETEGALFDAYKIEKDVHYGRCIYCGEWLDLINAYFKETEKYGSGCGEWLYLMPIEKINITTPFWLSKSNAPLEIYITFDRRDLNELATHLRRSITKQEKPDGTNRFIRIKEGNVEIIFQEEG